MCGSETGQQTTYRTIGVLGGMGPAATVDFVSKIVSLTDAERDQEHMPLIVHNVPQIPDRSTAILAGSDAPLASLIDGVRTLERAGADVIAVACNTAHYWHDQMSRSTACRMLHIVDVVKRKLAEAGVRRVALLATSGTVRSAIYQRRLAGVVEDVMIPNDAGQETVDEAIRSVKSGGGHDAAVLAVAGSLLVRGADIIILGCTELPIAFSGSRLEPYCLDVTAALAESCIIAAGGRVRSSARFGRI